MAFVQEGLVPEFFEATTTTLPVYGHRHLGNFRHGKPAKSRVVVAHTEVVDDYFTRDVLSRLSLHHQRRGHVITTTVNALGQRTWTSLHRLVYEKYHGHLPAPPLEIDHVDQNKDNNVLNNLRAADPSTQMANRPKFRNNTSGYKGVSARTFVVKGVVYKYWVGRARPNRKDVMGWFPFTDDGLLSAARFVNKVYREHYPHVSVPNPSAEIA